MTATNPLRTLPRYGLRDDEMTKPSVLLFDWTGEDEDTVKWETVRRESPVVMFEPADEEPVNFRPGLGAHAGGIIVGAVLGACATIGLLSLISSGPEQADTAENMPFVSVAQVGLRAAGSPTVDTPLVMPVEGPVVQAPLGEDPSAINPTQRQRAARRSLLAGRE